VPPLFILTDTSIDAFIDCCRKRCFHYSKVFTKSNL